jgi:hypothetical protein
MPHEEGRRGGVAVVLWALLAVALYVFSVGPAARLHDEGMIPESASVIYSPLIFLAEHSAEADRFFQWYVRDVWKAGY